MKQNCVRRGLLVLGLAVALTAGLAAAPGGAASMAQGSGPEANTPGGAPTGGIAAAPLGRALTYQGRLEKDNAPVNGTCNLRFSLWDALAGGSQVGPTLVRTNVIFRYGLFTVGDLDFGSGTFNGDARWLKVEVQCPGEPGWTALSPRQALTAAPYATYAAQVGAHDHLGQTWTGADNPLTIGGSFAGPAAAPLILNNTAENGLAVGSAAANGVWVGAAGNAGVRVNSGAYGLYVHSAGVHGVEVASAAYEGLRVDEAGRRGVYVVSAATDGVVVDSAGDCGLRVESTGGPGLFIGAANADGVYVQGTNASGLRVVQAAGAGVLVDSAGADGVRVLSAGDRGGSFIGTNWGVYAQGNDSSFFDQLGDLELAGNYGEIFAKGRYLGLFSNHHIYLDLDDDDDQSGACLGVLDGDDYWIWAVCEDKGTWSVAPAATLVQTADGGTRGLYALSGTEVWLEDVGRGRLVGGEAVIAIDPAFAQAANLADYYVYLTPLGDEPVLLYVPAKTPAHFAVRGVRLDGKPASCAFDYRIVAHRLGYEGVRLPSADELGLNLGKETGMEVGP